MKKMRNDKATNRGGYDRTILTIREGQKARVTGDCMPKEETGKH